MNSWPIDTTFAQLNREAQKAICFAHPQALPGTLPSSQFCISWTPNSFSATSEWEAWRDERERSVTRNPASLNCRIILAAAEAALAWRAALPEKLHFWKDEDGSFRAWRR